MLTKSDALYFSNLNDSLILYSKILIHFLNQKVLMISVLKITTILFDNLYLNSSLECKLILKANFKFVLTRYNMLDSSKKKQQGFEETAAKIFRIRIAILKTEILAPYQSLSLE